MKRQRVTDTRAKKASDKTLAAGLRPFNSFRTLSVLMLFAVSILMTGTSSFLYKYGLDPLEFYSNLANPYMKLVNVPAGLRREEIAEKFAKILSWDQGDIDGFLNTAPKDDRGALDGYYMPGPYWVKTTSTGAEIAHQMLRSFNSKVSEQILNKGASLSGATSASSTSSSSNALAARLSSLASGSASSKNKAQKINLDTAVRVASIIQREAAGKQDMNLISGVIWNRIFKGMSLDMDATLQYAKASQGDISGAALADQASGDATSTIWWPKVASKDKYIDSPFNTYKNKGLPPTAIANPSIQAIAAAFNPAKTDCLFYLHDDYRNIHCAKTYEAHKDNVQKYLVGTR